VTSVRPPASQVEHKGTSSTSKWRWWSD
jgi:hypothetical protein